MNDLHCEHQNDHAFTLAYADPGPGANAAARWAMLLAGDHALKPVDETTKHLQAPPPNWSGSATILSVFVTSKALGAT